MIKIWGDSVPGFDPGFGQDEPSLKPFLVEASQPTSAMVICPGGGYVRLAPHEADPVAGWLNSVGISAFVLTYRTAPYRHPYPLLDGQRAIRYLRAHAEEFNIDGQRIGILGFSAGGHLASTVGTHFDNGDPDAVDPVERQSSRPDCLVLCYPVISFGVNRHQGSMVNLLGENPSEDLRKELSNELQVTSDTPPAFLWHTAEDTGVSVANSILFAQALGKYQIPYELHIFAKGPHGIGLAKDYPQASKWTDLCAGWLHSIGF